MVLNALDPPVPNLDASATQLPWIVNATVSSLTRADVITILESILLFGVAAIEVPWVPSYEGAKAVTG